MVTNSWTRLCSSRSFCFTLLRIKDCGSNTFQNYTRRIRTKEKAVQNYGRGSSIETWTSILNNSSGVIEVGVFSLRVTGLPRVIISPFFRRVGADIFCPFMKVPKGVPRSLMYICSSSAQSWAWLVLKFSGVRPDSGPPGNQPLSKAATLPRSASTSEYSDPRVTVARLANDRCFIENGKLPCTCANIMSGSIFEGGGRDGALESMILWVSARKPRS